MTTPAHTDTSFALVAFVNDVLWRLADDYGLGAEHRNPRMDAFARARIGEAFAGGLDPAAAAFVTACDLQRGLWRRWPLPGCPLAA